MKIISDNEAIQKNLRYLQQIMEDHGGWVDPEISIKCEAGSLSIEKEGFSNPDKPILALRSTLLLPVDKMGLHVKNDDILCTPEKGALTDIQDKISQCMIELYNLTGKVKLHRETSCWFTFRKAPDLLARLLESRTMNQNQKKFLAFTAGKITSPGEENKILCETYLKSRTLGHKDKHSGEEGFRDQGSGDNSIAPKIMPMVDFLNHHHSGSFYNFQEGNGTDNSDYNNKEFLVVNDRRPLPFSNECFTYYNQMDPVDSFIGYGFSDFFASYVRSVPLELKIPNTGKIIVNSILGNLHKGKLPENAAGLRPYIPHTTGKSKEALEISHLLIPANPGMPHALRRVLRILISNRVAASRSLNAAQIQECILVCEEKILKTNIKFYKDLLAHIESAGIRNNPAMTEPAKIIRDLATLQLTKLYKYSFDDSHFREESANVQTDEQLEGAGS